jgi:hypothetical protein
LIKSTIRGLGVDERGQRAVLCFWDTTPGEYEAHGYKLCLIIKELKILKMKPMDTSYVLSSKN